MLEKIQPKIGKIGSLPSASRFIRELPFETICVAIAAFLVIRMSHNGSSFAGDFPLIRCLLSVVFIAPLGFSITLLNRGGSLSRKLAFVAYALLSVAGLAFAYFLRDLPQLAIGWRFASAFAFSVASPFIASAFSVPNRNREAVETAFSGFIRAFVENATAGSVYGGAAAIAILVIFAGISTLFEIFPDELLVDVLTFLTAISVLIFFESLLRPPTKKVSRLWHVLTKKIAAPFVAAMVSVVGIYEIWVLVTGQMPKNTLSPLLIATGVIGIIAALVIQAMLDGETVSSEPSKGVLQRSARVPWERRLSIVVVKWFHVAMFFLLPMGIWAVFARVDQYGFTPFRVARLAVLLALFLISIAGIIRLFLKKGPVSFDAALIVLTIAGLTSFGPLSAVGLSLASQTARLQEQISSLGITGIIPSQKKVWVSDELHGSLQTTAGVIRDLGGLEALSAAGVHGAVDECRSWDCPQALGVLREGQQFEPDGTEFSKQLSTDAPLELQRGLYMPLFKTSRWNELSKHAENYAVVQEKAVFELWEDHEKISEIDLSDFAFLSEEQSTESKRTIEMGKLILFPSEKPGGLGGIVLQEIEFDHLNGSISQIRTIKGLWLLPSAASAPQ